MSEAGSKNTAVVTADAIIHTTIVDVASNAAIIAAQTELPWLKLPIISSVFKWAVQYVFGFVSKYIELAAAFSIIDAQTNAEAKEYQQAIVALKDAQKSGDQDVLTKAKKDFHNTLASLIHYRTE